MMNGFTLTGYAAVGPNPGPGWRAAGSGDFNGDGKSDILWQHEGGQAAVWMMNGFELAGYAAVGPIADERVAAYRAASLLKIAGRRYRSLAVPEWPLVPALLDAAATLVGPGATRPGGSCGCRQAGHG
jgi:hypothetical protein